MTERANMSWLRFAARPPYTLHKKKSATQKSAALNRNLSLIPIIPFPSLPCPASCPHIEGRWPERCWSVSVQKTKKHKNHRFLQVHHVTSAVQAGVCHYDLEGGERGCNRWKTTWSVQTDTASAIRRNMSQR